MKSPIIVNDKKYYKPNMTNLKGRRGRKIIEAIMNQPTPDWERLQQEAAEIEGRIRREHEQTDR